MENLITADDQLFGNTYGILMPDGSYTKGKRPLVSWGCWGIIDNGINYDVFDEDDGYYSYWTTVDSLQLHELHYYSSLIFNSVKYDKKYNCKFVDKIPKCKPVHIKLLMNISGQKHLHMITFKVNDQELTFHPHWLSEFIKLVKLKPNHPQI